MDLDSGPVTQQSENHIGHHDTVTSMLPTVSHHCFLFHFPQMNRRYQMEHYESLHLQTLSINEEGRLSQMTEGKPGQLNLIKTALLHSTLFIASCNTEVNVNYTISLSLNREEMKKQMCLYIYYGYKFKMIYWYQQLM